MNNQNMGIRRLMSRGGQNFPGGPEGAKKDSIIIKKVKKTDYIWPAKGRGQEPPLPLPLLEPMNQKIA